MGCSGCGKSKKEFKEMVDSQVKLGSEEVKETVDPIQELKDDINYLNSVKKGEYLNKLLEKKLSLLEKMQSKESKEPEPKGE